MSISDNSGNLSTRGADAGADPRADATRPGDGWARYEGVTPAADSGGGGGGSAPPPDAGQGKGGDPFSGSDATGESRPCAVVIKTEEWRTAEDERVCPECAPLDRQWFPEGQGPMPPLHDHCRCVRVFVWWDCYASDGSWEKGGRPY